MSRGHGRVEASILDILNGSSEPWSVLSLAVVVYGDTTDAVSPVHVSAVRRALSNLRRQGKAFSLGRRYANAPYGKGLPVSVWASEEVARAYVAGYVKAFGTAYLDQSLLPLVPPRTAPKLSG
jgi:hypothetical protein